MGGHMPQTPQAGVDEPTPIPTLLGRIGVPVMDDMHIQLFKHPFSANLKRAWILLSFVSLLLVGFFLGGSDFAAVLLWVQSLDIKILPLICLLGIRPAKPLPDGWTEVPYEDTNALCFHDEQLRLIKRIMQTKEYALRKLAIFVEFRQGRRFLKVRHESNCYYICAWSG